MLRRLQLVRWSVFFAILVLMCGLQSTLWPYFFGSGPMPQLWFIVVLYLILYRPFQLSFFLVYLSALFVGAFSATPLGLLMISLGSLTAVVSYIKNGFFWPNTRYFVMACLASSTLFHFLFWIFSYWLEANPAPPAIDVRIFEVLLTTLFSIPIYWLLRLWDRSFRQESSMQIKVSLPE